MRRILDRQNIHFAVEPKRGEDPAKLSWGGALAQQFAFQNHVAAGG